MAKNSPQTQDKVPWPRKAGGLLCESRRLALQLSQEALADAASIDRSHMGKIERGERNVTFLNICRIAAAIQCKPSDLLIDAELW